MTKVADTAYRMNSETRARNVLKDLSRIAREDGLGVKNPALQHAVAGIFGYEGWKELLASIGGHDQVGPEDNQLEAGALAARRELQVTELERIGFPSVRARDVLAKLRPTGRTDEALKAERRLPVIRTTFDYHPNRLQRTWQSLNEFHKGFDGYFGTGEELLEEWGRNLPMLPADRAVCMRGGSLNETFIEFGFDVIEGGYMFDASAAVSKLADREVTVDTCLGIPEPYRDGVYVHFGANAFPSPYRDVGVEGAYVHLYYGTDYGDHIASPYPESVDVKLVCSDPFKQDHYDEEGSLRDHLQELRNLLRGPTFSFSPFENHTPSSELHCETEEEGEYWLPYALAPVTAAVNAVRAFVDGAVRIIDAVPDDMSREDVRRIERASTERKFLEAVKAADERLVVRFMDREPPVADVLTEETVAYVGEHVPADGDYLLAQGFEIQGYWPDEALKIARRGFETAMGLKDDDLSGGVFTVNHANGLMIHTLMRAIAHGEGGRDDGPELAALRREIEGHVDSIVTDTSNHSREFLPIAWLAARIIGSDSLAARAEARFGSIRAATVREAISILAEDLEFFAEDIAAGHVARVFDWFVSPVYAQTALAQARQGWDRWFTPSMIMPRTPELDEAIARTVAAR
ncbi:hypothetical protein D3C71_360760 [compost metagenome]